eukprot:819240_1
MDKIKTLQHHILHHQIAHSRQQGVGAQDRANGDNNRQKEQENRDRERHAIECQQRAILAEIEARSLHTDAIHNKAQLLSEITKISLEHSSTNSRKRRAMKMNGSSKSHKSNKSNNKMTIDGTTVDPIDPMSNNKSHLSVNKSIKSTVSEHGNISDTGNASDGDVSDNPSVDEDGSKSPNS